MEYRPQTALRVLFHTVVPVKPRETERRKKHVKNDLRVRSNVLQPDVVKLKHRLS